MNRVTDFFAKLFHYADWSSKWQWGNWLGFEGWVFIISDLLTWSVFFTISVYIVRAAAGQKEKVLTNSGLLLASIILSCGATHYLSDVISFWFRTNRLNAVILFTTGILVELLYAVRLPLVIIACIKRNNIITFTTTTGISSYDATSK